MRKIQSNPFISHIGEIKVDVNDEVIGSIPINGSRERSDIEVLKPSQLLGSCSGLKDGTCRVATMSRGREYLDFWRLHDKRLSNS